MKSRIANRILLTVVVALALFALAVASADGYSVEGTSITGLEASKTYEIAQVNVTSDFNNLDYDTITGVTEIEDCVGLYAIREAGETTNTLIYVKGDQDARAKLGVVSTNNLLDYQKTASFVVGKWTADDLTNPGKTDTIYHYNVSGPLRATILRIKSGTNANKLKYIGQIVDNLKTKKIAYAYAKDEIIPVDELVEISFYTAGSAGGLNFTTTPKVVFHVMGTNGAVTKYEANGASFAHSNSSTNKTTIKLSEVAGLPTTGWIVGVEFYPFASIDATIANVTADATVANFKAILGFYRAPNTEYVIKLQAEKPTLSYTINENGFGFDIKVTNSVATNTYKYKLDGAAEWETLEKGVDTFTVADPGKYLVVATGETFDGETDEADITVVKATPEEPTLSASYGLSIATVTVTDYSPKYKYEYQKEGDASWTEFTGAFNVTKVNYGTYKVRVSGLAYDGDAKSSIVLETPADIANIRVENGELVGLDTAKTYSYAYQYINGVGSYTPVSGVDKISGVTGLLSVKIGDGAPFVVYIPGSASDRATLGVISNNDAAFANTADWSVGAWTGSTGFGSTTEIKAGATAYIRIDDATGLVAGDFSALEDATDKTEKQADIKAKLEAIKLRYAYDETEIIPVKELIEMSFYHAQGMGTVKFTAASKTVVYVMGVDGTVTPYSTDGDAIQYHSWMNPNQAKRTIVDVQSISGLPAEGWIVGVEFYPFGTTDASTITAAPEGDHAKLQAFVGYYYTPNVDYIIKAPAEAPTFEVTANEDGLGFDINVTNAVPTNTYKYRKEGDSAWTTLNKGVSVITVAEVGNYEVSVSGDYLEGDASAVCTVAKLTPASPTLSTAYGLTYAVVTISDYSPAYKYEYQKSGETSRTPIVSKQFTITSDNYGEYIVYASGVAYEGEATASLTLEIPSAIRDIRVEDGKLVGLDSNTTYKYAYCYITGTGDYTQVTAGVTELTSITGLISLIAGDMEPCLIYIPGSASARANLGVITGGLPEYQNTAEWRPGKWTGRTFGFAHNTGEGAYAFLDDGVLSVSQMNAGDKAFMAGELNKVKVKYAYDETEILPVDELLSMAFYVGATQGSIKFTASPRALFYVMGSDGVVTSYSYDFQALNIQAGGQKIVANASNFNFPSSGWIVGVELYPFYSVDQDSITILNVGGEQDKFNALNGYYFTPGVDYIIKMEAEAPTFSVTPNETSGFDITVTNSVPSNTYKYRKQGETAWTTLAKGVNVITVQEVGTYEVSVSGDYLIGTAEANCTVEKLAFTSEETPSLNYGISSSTTFEVVITNPKTYLTYEYKKADASVWSPVVDYKFTVNAADIGDYEVRASGSAYDGYTTGSVTVALASPITPNLSKAYSTTSCTISITNYSDLYVYEYKKSTDSEWTLIEAGKISFTVSETDFGTYEVRASGSVFYAPAVATVTIEELPAEIKNLKVEGDAITGLVTSKSYQYAVADLVKIKGNNLVYNNVPAGASSITGLKGLYAVKAGGDAYLFYVPGDDNDRATLGTITDGLPEFESTTDWVVGKWTGSTGFDSTHSEGGAYWFYDDATGIGAGDIASGNKASLKEKLEAIVNKYAYDETEIVPANGFIEMSFFIRQGLGSVKFTASPKAVFHIAITDTEIVTYTVVGEPASHQEWGDVNKFTVNAANDPNFPTEGYIVGVELYPFGEVKESTIVGTPDDTGSHSKLQGNFGYYYNPANEPNTVYIVKYSSDAAIDAVVVANAPENGYGEISGLDPMKKYLYKEANGEWIEIPAGTTYLRLPAGTYTIKIANYGTYLESKEREITITILQGTQGKTYLQNETKKIYLPNDFVEAQADYELDVSKKKWISTLALENIKLTSPDSVVTFLGDGFKYVVKVADINVDSFIHYYNLDVTFNGASKYDTSYEMLKENAGEGFVLELFTESITALPFKKASFYVYVGTEYNSLELEVRTYNERIGRIRKLETTVVDKGWASLSKFGGAYVIVSVD